MRDGWAPHQDLTTSTHFDSAGLKLQSCVDTLQHLSPIPLRSVQIANSASRAQSSAMTNQQVQGDATTDFFITNFKRDISHEEFKKIFAKYLSRLYIFDAWGEAWELLVNGNANQGRWLVRLNS